jgi:peptidoglycan/LPS O-acetylase OafA/YrhL
MSRAVALISWFLRPSAAEGRRPALDGLRALAVILVFMFHVKRPHLQGGFLGVDLFFVLSGYLITQLLFAELARTGKVSLGAFWGRRAKRLLPAFAVLAVAVVVFGARWAPGFLRGKVQRDLVWSLAYLANWRFITSSSYFANDGTMSPLEHVWSLAIEEQFYVLWPLTFVIAASLARRLGLRAAAVVGLVALALAAVSLLLLAHAFEPSHPERAYMGTDTRAFDPLFGVLLAALREYDGAKAFFGRVRWPLFLVSALGVTAGVLTLGRAEGATPTYFRGGAVAFAAACAALIAAVDAGPSVFARVLAFGPVEKLGAVSYGFYLWHWPLTMWMGDGKVMNDKLRWQIFGATIAAALVSYVLVERPIRHGFIAKHLSPARLAFATPVLVGAIMSLAVLFVKPPPKQGFTVLIVGDSVPMLLLPTFAKEADARHWTVYSAAVGRCATFPYVVVDTVGKPSYGSEACPTDVGKAQREMLEGQRPDVVVWWSHYDVADRVEPDGRHIAPGTDEYWKAQEEDLRHEVDFLEMNGARVLFIEQDRPGKGMLARCTKASCLPFLRQLLDHHDDWVARWNAMVRRRAREDSRITVTNIDDVFCHDHAVPCDDSVDAPEAWARPDGTHFGETGGPRVVRAILDRAGSENAQ